jgi:EAL domain-containing protein (putative c-di-GMP-specific phosphodiesterase class I)
MTAIICVFSAICLKKHGIPPQLIEMEISCNIFLKNSQAAKTFLKRLKDMGISVSIDDFGAGFSR